MQRHYLLEGSSYLMGCIVSAKTWAFIDLRALLIVDWMASGAQVRAGMCRSPSWQCYWPAALSYLSRDWLRVAASRTRGSVFRSTGLHWCFSSSCCSHPGCMDLCVCVCVCVYARYVNLFAQDPCRHRSLSVSILSSPPASISPPLCLVSRRSGHTHGQSAVMLCKCYSAQIKVRNE